MTLTQSVAEAMEKLPNLVRRELLPPGLSRPRQSMTPEGLVIHSTANPDSTAQNNRDWFARQDRRLPSGAANRSGAHVIADDREIIVAVPYGPGDAEIAYHCGNPGNSLFVGLEVCEFRNRDRAMASYYHSVAAAAMMLYENKLLPTFPELLTHNMVRLFFGGTDHTDPHGYLRSLGLSWPRMARDISMAMQYFVPDWAKVLSDVLIDAGLLHEARGTEDFWRAAIVAQRMDAANHNAAAAAKEDTKNG